MRRRSVLAIPLAAPLLLPASAVRARGIAEDLRHGGYVIYMRHAETFASPEPTLGDFRDCLWQRNLTPAGKAQAEATGEHLRKLGTRYSRVWSSPFCRCRDTAQLVATRVAEQTEDLLYHVTQTPNQQTAGVERLRILLSNREPGGRVTLLVGHAPPFKSLTGIELAEGRGAIIRPRQTKEFDIAGYVDATGVHAR